MNRSVTDEGPPVGTRRTAGGWLTLLLRVVEEWIPAVLLGVMVVILVVEVVLRYAFASPMGSAAEIALLLMIWTVYLSAAAVARRGIHVAVDLLPLNRSERMSAVFDLVVEAIVLAVMLPITLISTNYLLHGSFATLPATGLSKSVITAALVVGLVLMCVHTARALIRALVGSVRGSYQRVEDVLDSDEYEDFDTGFVRQVEAESLPREEGRS